MNDSITTAAQEARTDAAWLAAHGYHMARVWRFGCALDNYGPESSRTSYAAGYAVQYAGTLVRDDGSTAEYPTAGIKIYCHDDQLPLSKLLAAGRAVVTFGDGDRYTYGPYTPYYVAAWNPRETDTQRNPEINPGTLQTVLLHELTALVGGDGPKRFYDLRLDPAGEWLPGDRVRVTGGDLAGESGTVRAGESVMDGDRWVTVEAGGRFRHVKVADLQMAG